MVAAAKLRRAQDAAQNARPYAERMARGDRQPGGRRLGRRRAEAAGRHRLATSATWWSSPPPTAAWPAASTPPSSAPRATASPRCSPRARTSRSSPSAARRRDQLRRQYANRFVDSLRGRRQPVARASPRPVAEQDPRAVRRPARSTSSPCSISRFQSVVTQTPTAQAADPRRGRRRRQADRPEGRVYEYEPDEETILAEPCCRATSPIQIFSAMLENQAGFFAAQMTAMDNATRNAGDMIASLTLQMNRSPPGADHQGADRDHLRRRSDLDRTRWTMATTTAAKKPAAPRPLPSARPPRPPHPEGDRREGRRHRQAGSDHRRRRRRRVRGRPAGDPERAGNHQHRPADRQALPPGAGSRPAPGREHRARHRHGHHRRPDPRPARDRHRQADHRAGRPRPPWAAS